LGQPYQFRWRLDELGLVARRNACGIEGRGRRRICGRGAQTHFGIQGRFHLRRTLCFVSCSVSIFSNEFEA